MSKKQLPLAKITKSEEDWMTKKWRPMMAIMYMMVCLFDFIVFPIMFTVVQFWETSAANDAFRQWSPLTLLGGGLFHVAMGAVLGVSAWSRGQEKIAGVANGPAAPALPAAQLMPTSFAPPPAQSTAFSPAPSWATTPVANNSFDAAPSVVQTGWGGKKAPPAPNYPEI